MALGFGIERPLISQILRTFSISIVGAASPVPLDVGGNKQQLITSFVISNPSGGNSAFFGGPGVNNTTGLEIQSGTSPVFTIDNQGRQLYELQGMLGNINAGLKCSDVPLEKIPFVVFDLSQYFLFALVNVTVSVATFPTMYL